MRENDFLKVASVAFTIAGRSLDFEGISSALKIKPSYTHRMGDPNILGKPFQHDMWQLESGLSESEPLYKHFAALIAKLRPHYDYLRQLKEIAEIYVYCGLNCDADQSGFSLPSKALRLFTDLEISLEGTVLVAG